jgi:hypothetical protein
MPTDRLNGRMFRPPRVTRDLRTYIKSHQPVAKGKGVVAIKPLEPIAPVEPVEPVAPIEPEEPVAPVEPIAPVEQFPPMDDLIAEMKDEEEAG